MADATWLDATAQADLVRRGEVSPKDLAEAAIAAIEAVNPQLDAVIRTRFEAARVEADGALPDGATITRDGPLSGRLRFCPTKAMAQAQKIYPFTIVATDGTGGTRMPSSIV